MRKLYFFLFFFLLQFCVSTFAQNPYIRHYTTLDGLPTNTIYQIFQDSHKFLWFTSDAGLVKFDGFKFTSYRKKDGLSSNDVVRIKEDSKGRIWVFNYNGSVNYILNDRIYNGNNAPFLNSLIGSSFILDFLTDSSHTIHFYTWQREVFSLDKNNKVSKYRIFNTFDTAVQLKRDEMERVKLAHLDKGPSDEWIVWASAGIYRLQILPTSRITIVDSTVNCMAVFPASNNTNYVKTYYYNELLKVTGDFQKEKIPIPCDLMKIKTIIEDSEGYLWMAAYDEGVYCLKNKKVIRHFDIKDALGLLQDHEQNIWVSTQSNGVYMINHDLLEQNHLDRTNFDNYGINQLCDFPGMGIWCTSTKAAYLLKNDVFYKLFVAKNIQPVNLIYQFKNRTLMLGSISNQLCTFENIIPKVESKSVGYSKKVIYPVATKKIIDDRLGYVTAMVDQNSILFTSPVKPSLSTQINRISERINNAYFNANNEFVINAKRNFLYKNYKLEPYAELSRFDGTIISDHLFLDDSAELFNIDGDSLYILKNHKFYNLTNALDTPFETQINKILYDDSTLYLVTLKDIYICHYPTKVLSRFPVHLESLNISFNNINDILIHKDTLYIASDDGLTVISEASISKSKAVPPLPYLQSITLNDKIYFLPDYNLKLTGKNKIQLSFGCISYSPSPVIYSYMLKGAENKWTVETGSGINLLYQNLPKGSYVFKLRVRKLNSDWSKPLELAITIKPTLVEYPLFWAVIVLIVSGITFLIIYMIRIQKIKRVEVDYQLVVMEQKALQSMMNPHFIFNSLGSIQNYLLKNKGSEAIIYLSNFARLIRQNLNAINTPMILLEEEVDRLKNYLDLEKIRLENKFEYRIEMDKVFEEDDVYIPGMIIQPIVENSIWHGIATLKEPGNIVISFKVHSPKSLKIRIEDNGVGMKQSMEYFHKDPNRQHLGMNIIEKRLNLLSRKYSTKTSISYSESYPGMINPGVMVELIVPFTYSTSDS